MVQHNCNKTCVFQSWDKRHEKTKAARVRILLQEINKMWPSTVEDVEESRTGSDVNVPIARGPPTNLVFFTSKALSWVSPHRA